jgi:ATP-binding cassette subfamily C (CFTR/MRP) protein 1
MIGHVKNIKISGLTQPIETLIHNLRLFELRAGGQWRRLITLSVAVSYAPLVLSPVVAFAFDVRPLDTTSIFLSVSYMNLLTTPLCILLQKLLLLLAALTCVHRVQTFLEQKSRVNFCCFQNSALPLKEGKNLATSTGGSIDMYHRTPRARPSNESIVNVIDGSFGWADDRYNLTLQFCAQTPKKRSSPTR